MAAPAPGAPPALPALDNTFGATLISVILAGALWGISVVQTWIYFTSYTNDMWFIKALVATTFALDTTHQALISHTVYYYLITNYANPVALGSMTWSILVEALFTALTGLLVQSFLTYRVWRLSHKNYYVTAFLMIGVLGTFVITVVWTVKSLKLVTFQDLTSLKVLTRTINIITAVTDVLIAAALVYLLHGSRTGFKKSDTMISRLMIFTINTGLLTSVCAIMSLVTNLKWPNALIYAVFYFCIGRLYTNSLLATLNARKAVRGGGDLESMSVSLSNVSTAVKSRTYTTSAPSFNPPSKGGNIAIKIDTTKEFHTDQKVGSLGSVPDHTSSDKHDQYKSVLDLR